MEIAEKVRHLIEPVVCDAGLELVDVVFTFEMGARVLRLFVDRPDGGVTLDELGDISPEISRLLDVEDMIPGHYTLEVSSPGLDRPLVKEKDFVRYVGKNVRIRTKEPIEGRRNFKARLKGIFEGVVYITDNDGNDWRIELKNIDKARLEIELQGTHPKRMGRGGILIL
ncbi:MAG: ribosome maturation factor RimP [Deltaproteobacteria bacterium]|nr:ribosome maturation factor RimP [Deltaproteobacteria bacterium]